MKPFITACVFAASAFLSTHAGAVAISGLYNTGQGIASGTRDTHYKLTVQQGKTVLDSAQAYATWNGIWPISPWMGNGEFSKWLTPKMDQGASYDPSTNGVYQYRLSFDLTGYAPASASLAGRFLADNAAQVFLNGSLLAGGSSFSQWTTFAANTGFKAGINTLDFVVLNYSQSSGNPTGLRTEFTSSSVNAVPEPGSVALLLGGLGMMGMVARRKRGGGGAPA